MANKIFARIGNLINGFFSLFVKSVEEKNPGIAYENSINEMKQKRATLKTAAGKVIRLRDDILEKLDVAEKEQASIKKQLQACITRAQQHPGEPKFAAMGQALMVKKNQLDSQITELNQSAEKAVAQADSIKVSLNELGTQVKSLVDERDHMLASFESAEARIAIQDSLNGLADTGDAQALENSRMAMKNKIAEANLGDELEENDIDKQLAGLRADAQGMSAMSEFEALVAKSQDMAVEETVSVPATQTQKA